MAKSADYGLGSFTYPRGWFMVASSEEIKNEPLALKYFGQDLVIYRGTSGRIVVLDAYCPHMKAHLGKNTTSYIVTDGNQIEGDSIRCPFHGWRFTPEGRCDDIPYSPAPPSAHATIASWLAVERAGCVFVWHDPEGGSPDYEVPAIPEWDDGGWVRWRIDHLGDIDCHPVEVVDNLADRAHFGPIHGSGEAEYFENEFKDHTATQYFAAGHKTLSDHILTTDTCYTGPGILLSRAGGSHPAILQICHTPIEDGRIRVWESVLVKCGGSGDDRNALAAQYQDLHLAALMQDYEIWANKRACMKPLAVRGDGPIGRVREWYRQFYNPRAELAKLYRKTNGRVVTRGTRRAPWGNGGDSNAVDGA